ncbi:GNAT family protein [Virgibacillus sp. 179-BFC.A HS]|uniref:GNAT family protein n=1 Tax=Tigheibacillus jepli TaxID=3035914 RepID=A0ABU5CKF9_9BACI|nr:GNAT family protein [Virgibacillus sp. 179-BFC.A HS]MDY0406800.1 GNAT family protein [Virgibacillus sp. 179-BFC.A HS]
MYKAVVSPDIYLSILEYRHADELYKLVDGSRDSIGQWLSFPSKTHKVEDSKIFIEKSLKRFAEGNGYWAGIWYREKLAGSVGYLYIDWKDKKTEIGYWLGKNFEGIGLATQACKLLIDHAFSELKLNKVEINVASNNEKSKAIPKRLGFKNEGCIRSYEFLNGEYLDRVVFGQLKDEWAIKKA